MNVNTTTEPKNIYTMIIYMKKTIAICSTAANKQLENMTTYMNVRKIMKLFICKCNDYYFVLIIR